MTTKQQSGTHLDADLLNAYVEGALSAPERALCLDHLAECARCREIAFVASDAAPKEIAPAAARTVRFGWWPTLSLSGAALAAVVVMGVVMYRSHRIREMQETQVAVEHPVSPSALVAPAPADRAAASNPGAPTSAPPLPAPKPTPKPESFSAPKSQTLRKVPLIDGAGIPAPSQAPATELQQAGAPPAPPATGAASIAPAPQIAEAPTENRKDTAAEAKKSYTLSINAAAAAKASSLDGSAQVSGTITDASGVVIPHATVTLYQATGTAHWETVTDSSGRFTISPIRPGKYRLEVTSPGFTMQSREVELGANQLAQLDSKLDVCSASEAVTVENANATVNTESASVQSELEPAAPMQSSLVVGERTLVLDATGKLLLRKKAGKPWKLVHGPWKKAEITGLSLTADQQFEIATGEGRWHSSDGEHWRSVTQP